MNFLNNESSIVMSEPDNLGSNLFYIETQSVQNLCEIPRVN